MTTYRISFQLYSARNFPPLEAQLEALAAIGFDAVEPYRGAFGDDAAGFRRKIDAVGLACPTAHLPVDLLQSDRAAFIDIARTLGLEAAILPYLTEDKRPKDQAAWKAFAAELTEHAAALAEAGLKLAWHTHAFEYEKLADGTRPIDALIAAPGVYYEPDIGWISRAGAGINAELERFPGKIVAFHVKDTAPAGVTRDDGWTDVGAGTIDWKAVWPSIAHSGCDLLVLENDNPSDWRGFAAHSHTFLSGLAGGKKA
jgi:sugar phosphate isomerase/epimerase